MSRVRIRILGASLALFALPFPPAAALDPGSASGWLEAQGQRVPLKFAFAAMEPDVTEGPGKEKIALLLSDQPVPPNLRKASDKWTFWAGEQAVAGALHGVILYIDPERRIWNRGQFLSRDGLEFYSESASSPELSGLVFTPAAAGENEIAGKVSMKEPRRLIGQGAGEWRVDAEFRTAVLLRPAVTATLTGAAALNSPQYKAVLAFLRAGQKKDLEAIRRTMSSDSLETLSRMIEARGAEPALGMFAEQAAETLRHKPSKVVVRGDSATVEFAVDPNTTTAMHVVLENGAWKIGQ